jgi:hypothetical protein
MSTAQAVSPTVGTLSVAELETLIRRIVWGEITLALDERGIYPEPTVIEPGSPIYEDLVELLRLKEEGQFTFWSYEQVFRSDDLTSDGGEIMSTVQTVSQAVNTLSVAELEALIRRIVRKLPWRWMSGTSTQSPRSLSQGRRSMRILWRPSRWLRPGRSTL